MKYLSKILQNIFKFFSYKIYALFHGQITGKIKPENHSNIKNHILEKDEGIKYKIYKIKDGRLYTDRVHDLAIMINNSIVEGPSYQYRPINNASVDQNIVFSKGTPRKKKYLNGLVFSLLSGGAANDNYFHWIFDVIPRFALCEHIVNLEEVDFFLLPDLKKNYQRETLKLLNIPLEKCLSSKFYRHIQAKEIIVTDHPYVISNDAHKDIQNIPIWISKWLKKKYTKNSISNNSKYPKKIYINRDDSTANMKNARLIINEDEVKYFLEKRGFTSLKLANFMFDEQIEIFKNAEIIVGLHGAGFANIIFCKSNTKIIEFNNTSDEKVIENLALSNDMIYKSINSTPIKFDNKNQYGHINVSLEKLKDTLESLK